MLAREEEEEREGGGLNRPVACSRARSFKVIKRQREWMAKDRERKFEAINRDLTHVSMHADCIIKI